MKRTESTGLRIEFSGWWRRVHTVFRPPSPLLCLLLLAGCVPATVPPQLSHTPGAPVRFANGVYDAGVFTVRPPEGWRVITSPAASAPFVIFAAPDNCALILVAVEPMDAPPSAACPETDFRSETRTPDDLYLVGLAPAAQWDDFAAVLERAAESAERAE